MRRRFRHPIVPGNKLHAAAAFLGMSFLRDVNEKILERPQQERAEPPAVTIGVLQPIVLQNGHEKILSEVLCVLDRKTACVDKGENRSPISTAKLGEGATRLLLFAAIGGGKDEAPAGSYKLARSVSTPLATLPVHERTLGFSRFYTSNKR